VIELADALSFVRARRHGVLTTIATRILIQAPQ